MEAQGKAWPACPISPHMPTPHPKHSPPPGRGRVHRDEELHPRVVYLPAPLPQPSGRALPPQPPRTTGLRRRAWGFSPAPPAGRPRPLTSLSLRCCGRDPRLSHRSPCPVLLFPSSLPLAACFPLGTLPLWTVAGPLGISTAAQQGSACRLVPTRHRPLRCRTLLGSSEKDSSTLTSAARALHQEEISGILGSPAEGPGGPAPCGPAHFLSGPRFLHL